MKPPNNALQPTGLALRARPSLASLGAAERGRWAPSKDTGGSIMNLAVRLAAVLGVLMTVPAQAAECLQYGPGRIEGTLTVETVPLQSGKGNETWFFVALDKPVCFSKGSHPKGYEPAVAEIRKIQLLHLDKTAYEQARALKGKLAECEGTLFGKWTEHHHSPVLLQGACVGAQQGVPADRPRPAGSAGG